MSDMAKVELSEEVANAITRLERKGFNMDQIAASILEAKVKGVDYLQDLTLSELTNALCFGWDIKCSYNVGDAVVNGKNSIGIIEEISGRMYYGKWYNGKLLSNMSCTKENFMRKATANEMKMALESYTWGKMDREVGEFKRSDRVKFDGRFFEVFDKFDILGMPENLFDDTEEAMTIDQAKSLYDLDKIQGVLPFVEYSQFSWIEQ